MKERSPTWEERHLIDQISDLKHNARRPFRMALSVAKYPLAGATAAIVAEQLSGDTFGSLPEWAKHVGFGIATAELVFGGAVSCVQQIQFSAQRNALAGDLRYLKEQAPEQPLEELAYRATILPPGGAKVIPHAALKENHSRLIPTLLQETIAGQVAGVSQSIAQDAPNYPITVQLTTAGRHKDPFKRAAMNMLLAHPYSESWGTPFFQAEWGELAPLIHDGGAQNIVVNRNWKHTNGRTDILFRLPADACTPEHQRPLEAYIASRARFFQRASFAAHCHHEITHGTEPETAFTTPETVKEAGATAWEDYAALSDRVLFGEYNLQGMLGSEEENRWFLPTDHGTRLKQYGPRFEADGDNSFFHLMAIEEAKRTNGRMLLQRAAACMDYLSDSVDDMLGLPISSRDSRFCVSE